MAETETEAAPPPAPVGEPIAISYMTRPGLGKIAIINVILIVLTLTVYRFWAKTNVRRHVWSCVHINGEPLEYTGRGVELFLGALLVTAVLGVPAIAVFVAAVVWLGPEHPALIGIQYLFLLIVAIFWGMAVYRARRYRLSRTLWRGIRSTLAGSSMSYSMMNFGALILRMMTLGWSTPAMNLNLEERMIGDMRFGNMPFRFRGTAGPLYGRYAICWFATLVVFIVVGAVAVALFVGLFGDWLKSGDLLTAMPTPEFILAVVAFAGAALLLFLVCQWLLWSIYVAREMNVFASYTSLDKARFKFDATAGSLVSLWVGNLLLVILTLGIATPFAQQRLVRYLCTRMTVEGTVNIASILQSREQLGRTGEGLADAFDIGGFI